MANGVPPTRPEDRAHCENPISGVIPFFGLPEVLLSDRGMNLLCCPTSCLMCAGY